MPMGKTLYFCCHSYLGIQRPNSYWLKVSQHHHVQIIPTGGLTCTSTCCRGQRIIIFCFLYSPFYSAVRAHCTLSPLGDKMRFRCGVPCHLGALGRDSPDAAFEGGNRSARETGGWAARTSSHGRIVSPERARAGDTQPRVDCRI